MSNNFKNAVNKAGDIAQAAVVKAGELAQEGAVRAKRIAAITRLKADNFRQEERCKTAWQEIGKLYYEQYGQESDAAFAELCLKVDEARAKIGENNASIQKLREEIPPIVDVGPETEDEAEDADFADIPDTDGETPLEDIAADIDQLADELERKADELERKATEEQEPQG